ncbi:hypothetical protein K466DRAFT_32103 [Polyporus arcularius HHB13444]|uniref:Uncharacterized protein n=1 Tax=Polyporus arcularius HHB13444 TaxID=1314778 RepID=A0A5C3NRI2_9APHY|nr:hypothetical protein K466DRAFT_32103 [Polyporus arcularius HHB13444]
MWAPRQLPDSIHPVRTRRRTSQASKSSPLDCILTSSATSTHTDPSSDNRPASACLALSRFDGSHEQRSRRHNCHQVNTLTTKWTPWSKYRLPLPWKPRTLRAYSDCDGEHMCPRTCTILTPHLAEPTVSTRRALCVRLLWLANGAERSSSLEIRPQPRDRAG